MAGVNAEISLSIRAQQIGSADLGSPRLTLDPISRITQLTQGTDSTAKANVLWQKTSTLAASTSEDWDLAGTLEDAFGNVITMAEVVAIYIAADAANVNNVVVGAATAPFAGPLGATGTYTIAPGEYFHALSPKGWAVGAGTTDDLKILNGGAGTAVTYDIVIIGRTAAA